MNRIRSWIRFESIHKPVVGSPEPPAEIPLNMSDYYCFPAAQRAGHHLFEEKCRFMTIGDDKPDDIACLPKADKPASAPPARWCQARM